MAHEVQPGKTPEALARDLHARIEFRRSCTVAFFSTDGECDQFSGWLKERGFRLFKLPDPLAVAYAAPSLVIQ